MPHPGNHPAIDFDKVTVDPSRLERALALDVARLEAHDPETGEVREGCYEVGPVSAQSAKAGILGHWVDLYSADVPRCDCGDHTFREVACKHILACLLAENHPVVASALRELVRALAEREAADARDIISRLSRRLGNTRLAPGP